MADYVGGVLGFASTMYNNHYAAQREAETRSENSRYNEIAAQNADLRTRALFNDLYSPQAQMEQLKKAGLSPSMFYSGGTAGGQGHAGAQGAGPSGISPNIFPIDPIGMAQIDLLHAQADKAQAEADRAKGKGEMGEADLAEIIARTGNYIAMQNYSNTQTELQQLLKETTIQEAKYKAQMAGFKAEQSYFDMLNAGIEFEVNEVTKNARIEKQVESVKLMIAQRLREYKQMQLTDKQIEEISTNISMMYDTSMREWALVDATLQNADTFRTEVNNKQWQFMQNLELELDKWGFDKDHWFKNKLCDFAGDLMHAGGYIIGLSMMKGGKNAGQFRLTSPSPKKFGYGSFNPSFNGMHNGIMYHNGLPVVPTIM